MSTRIGEAKSKDKRGLPSPGHSGRHVANIEPDKQRASGREEPGLRKQQAQTSKSKRGRRSGAARSRK